MATSSQIFVCYIYSTRIGYFLESYFGQECIQIQYGQGGYFMGTSIKDLSVEELRTLISTTV